MGNVLHYLKNLHEQHPDVFHHGQCPEIMSSFINAHWLIDEIACLKLIHRLIDQFLNRFGPIWEPGVNKRVKRLRIVLWRKKNGLR